MITEPPPTEGSAESPGSEDAPVPPSKGLHRDTEAGLIGGVCAGVSKATGWDVSLVRIAAVVLGIFSFGVVVYLVAWWLLPDQNDQRGFRTRGSGQGSGDGSESGWKTLGTVEVAVAAIVMVLAALSAISYLVLGFPGIHRFRRLVPSMGDVIDNTWPSWWVLAVIVGGALLFRRHRQASATNLASVTASAGRGDGTAPPAGVGSPSTPVPTPAPRPPRPPAVVGPITLLAAMVTALVAVALGLLGVTPFHPGVVAGLVLGVLAGGLIVSSRRGRARGLLLVALPLGLILAFLPLSRTRFDAMGRARDLTAAAFAGRTSPVEVTAGTWTLDLRDSRRHHVDSVSVRQVAGRVTVILPTDRWSVVDVTVGTGDIEMQRPSIQRAVAFAPTGEGLEIASGLTKGTPATDAQLRALGTGGLLEPLLDWSPPLEGRDSTRHLTSRVGSSDGEVPDLSVRVDLGVGSVALVDPRWSGSAPPLATPTQMCLTAGGALGVVTPCSQVPSEQRVPVCGSDIEGGWGLVYDCRAIATSAPQVACSDRRWNYVPCTSLGIVADPDFVAATGAAVGATVPPLGAPYPTVGNPSPIPDQVEAGGSTVPPPPTAPAPTPPSTPGQ